MRRIIKKIVVLQSMCNIGREARYSKGERQRERERERQKSLEKKKNHVFDGNATVDGGGRVYVCV